MSRIDVGPLVGDLIGLSMGSMLVVLGLFSFTILVLAWRVTR